MKPSERIKDIADGYVENYPEAIMFFLDEQAELLETETVKVEKCCENGDLLTAHNCLKEEPTTPENKCVGEGRHCFTHNQARIFCAIDRVEDRIGRTEKKCGDCEEWREFKEWYAKTKEWGGDYSEWEKLKTTEAKSICP